MFAKYLELKNYRNYQSLSIEFDKGINILYGDNAQGKTNILEAIYLCSVTKSHRGSKDKEIIQFGEEESHIKLLVKKNQLEDRIDMHLKRHRPKGIAVNQIPIRRASELFGVINVVLFSPEDLNIIKNGPSERRRFIDLELCQLDTIYINNLENYNKVVMQRNKLLKDLIYKPEAVDTLDIWDLQMIKFGTQIMKIRQEFIKNLNDIIAPIHQALTGGTEKMVMKYEPNVDIESFAKVLADNRERDMKQKVTLTGPHRDDINFSINGIDIRTYGSQGQQRTAALSLKMSEIDMVKKITRDTPILLLDDVLSELDRNRQSHLLDSIKDIQTIITCTGLDDFVGYRFAFNTVYKVREGTVKKEN